MFKTPTSPLPRNTYTLQEEQSEASESVASAVRPALRSTGNAQSARSIHTATSNHTDLGGGSSIAGGGSLDSPRTPGSFRSRGLDRDNNVMQQSVMDGKDTNASPLPERRLVPITPAADEEHRDASSDDDDDSFNPIYLWGIKLPLWVSQLIYDFPLSSARIASCVVAFAPCFWCGDRVQGSSTDRAVLTRLIVLCIFFSFLQMTASIWLSVTLLILDDSPGLLAGFAPNFWNLNGAALAIGGLAFVIIVSCVFTIRVIRVVDLVGAIRYLWVILWILPFEFFFNISLFDYHRVTRVWIEHWWREDTMSNFRKQFCEKGTENAECTVPIFGGPNYSSEIDWCTDRYNKTDACTDIRDKAQEDMETYMLLYYTGLAGVGCVLMGLLLLMVNSLERIISKPIVQKSRESNVPAWMTLPTSVSALVGSVFIWSQSSVLSASSSSDISWIGNVYLASSALFLVAALMGWFLSAFSIRNSADKKTKNVAVNIFITIMASNTVMIASLFVASFVLSGVLLQVPIDDAARRKVACGIDDNVSCTGCNGELPEQCPEWRTDDATRILQTQLKQSATVAAILILYSISVLRFGFVLRKHLSMYQIDYV